MLVAFAVLFVPSAAVAVGWLTGRLTGTSALILLLALLLALALRALWNYVPRPRVWLELRPSTGAEIAVEDANRQPLGYAKYFHVHVCSTTTRTCRGRMVDLREVRDGSEHDVPSFKPVELTWDGVDGLVARVEPDVPARLNIVCTESRHAELTILCVEEAWHKQPRGVQTTLGPGAYVAKIRITTDGSDEIVDGVFEIHAARHWQDLRVTQISAAPSASRT